MDDTNPDWPRVAWRLEELARDLGETHDVDDALQGVLHLVTELAPCDVASVSLRRKRSVETTAASDVVAERAHERQQELGEGPCVECEWDESGINIVPDLADDRRWPRWSASARELGLASVIAVRLFTRGGTVGALDLYSRHPCDYGHEDVLTARVLAARVSSVLAHVRHEENLHQAIDAHREIGQAEGILMAQYGISGDQAFSVLRRYSQETNRKLRLVAQGVIASRKLPTD